MRLEKIGIPPEKMIIEMEDVGNTVSSSIPLAIASAIRKGWNTEDNTLLLVGFGVGYSWAACQVKIKKPIQVN
jgi:3-oxoacyl-[acyl-carrier-protein] synthase-3